MLPIHDLLNARSYVLFVVLVILRHVLAFIYEFYLSFLTLIVRLPSEKVLTYLIT